MPSFDLTIIISLFTVIVAFLTMRVEYYVGKQGIKNDIYQSVTKMFNDLNMCFLQYPELRPYFYDCKDPAKLEPIDYQRALIIAEMVLDTFEWIEHDIKLAKKRDQDSWENYMLSLYDSSKLIQQFQNEHASWHPLYENLIQKKRRPE